MQMFESYLHKMMEDAAMPQDLKDAMSYSLFAGGKRIRPQLCMAIAEMSPRFDVTLIFPLAAATEMVHTYSLIHDDLPAMDNDDLRRGKLTNHLVFGEALAILAGDALLSHSFYVLQDLALDAENGKKINRLFAENIGIKGMITGQVLDIELEDQYSNITTQQIIDIAVEKTGRLFELALVGSAYVYGLTEKQTDILQTISIDMGKLFQAVDDYLDFDETQGKTIGSDEDNNKPSMLSLLGAESLNQYISELSQKIMHEIEMLETYEFECQSLRNLVLKITNKVLRGEENA